MRIFLAGATGAVGPAPHSIARKRRPFDHWAHALRARKRLCLCKLGAEPVVADALDRQAIQAAGQRRRTGRDCP